MKSSCVPNDAPFMWADISYFLATVLILQNSSCVFAVFCACHIVKSWPWVPVYFKHYHCYWQCGRERKTAKVCGRGRERGEADPNFQDPHNPAVDVIAFLTKVSFRHLPNCCFLYTLRLFWWISLLVFFWWLD